MEQHGKQHLKPYLGLALGALSLGFSAIFVSWADAPGVVSSFYRMAVGVVVFVVPAFQRPGRAVTGGKGTRLALLAGALFGMDMAFWSEGVLLGGATVPTLLSNTAPVWVGLGTWLIFGERLAPRFWIGLLLALAGAGAILLAGGSGQVDFGKGAVYGLAAGLLYGGFFLAAQRARRYISPVRFFWFSALGSCLVLAVVGAIRGVSFTAYPLETYGVFVAYGLVVQVAGWYAINYAQGYLSATVISPTLLGQPLITAALSVALLEEQFVPAQLAGGAAILGGIYLVHLSRADGADAAATASLAVD
jgi:drug/metabolite transporter (DMT)-like permease